MVDNFKKQFYSYIAKDNLIAASELLLNNLEYHKGNINQIVALQGQLKSLKNKIIDDTISYREATIRRNKIRKSLIEVAFPYNPVKRKILLLFSGIYLIIASFVIWWLFQPQPSYRIKAKLNVEQVSFKYIDGPINILNGKVESCYWQNYQTAELGGNLVFINKDSDANWDFKTEANTKIIVNANENISGNGLQFGVAELENLIFEPNAIVALSKSANDPSLLQISVEQTNQLQSKWSYVDSVDIELEMCELLGVNGVKDILSPVKMRVFSNDKRTTEFNLKSFSGNTNIDLYLKENITIEGSNLSIANLSFFKPYQLHETQQFAVVSTIIGGEIDIKNQYADKSLYKVEITKNEGLDILSDENFDLQNIEIGENDISLNLSGIIKKIGTGKTLKPVNISRINWLWYSNKLLIMVLLCGGLGFLILLLSGIWHLAFKI